MFGAVDCFSARHFVKEVFLDSDTDLAVLTFVPSLPKDTPFSVEEVARTRQIVESLQGTKRLLIHGRVHPNEPGDIERMPELAERWKISAWKTYTGFGRGGKGYWLDDPRTGIPFIEKARALGREGDLRAQGRQASAWGWAGAGAERCRALPLTPHC